MRYTFDSREVKPGMGFVALKGEKADGHDFIPQALAAGAADVIDGLDELQRRARERRRAQRLLHVGVGAVGQGERRLGGILQAGRHQRRQRGLPLHV